MDQFDGNLILQLENEGTLNYSTLAADFGVSERTVRRRIRNLINFRHIRPIVMPNLVKLEFRAWARIGIRVSPGAFSEVARALSSNPSIYFVAATLGRFDFMIAVYFHSIDELSHFVNSVLTGIKGINVVETFLLVHPRKYNQFYWPEPKIRINNNYSKYGNADSIYYDRYQLDPVEGKILDILLSEGLIKPKQISQRTGIGENTIRKRMKTMQEKELFKIEIIPITREFEYGARATIGIDISDSHPHKIIDSIVKHPSVAFASVVLGRHNIILVTRFRNTNLLDQFVTEFLASLSGINAIETFLHVRRLKYYSVIWPID